jgi:hypothetical protein
MRRAILLLLFLGLTTNVRAGLKMTDEIAIADDLVLVRTEFGLLEQEGSKVVRIKPVDTVPLVTGQAYGWRLHFRTKRETVAVREEFELPVAPKSWDTPPAGTDFKVSPDGRTGITTANAALDEGMIMNIWQVADGDPPGEYVIRLFVEGKLMRTFKFKVVAPPER